jgi:hypothetical protein
MGWAERQNKKVGEYAVPSKPQHRGRRLNGSAWDFIGEGNNIWYCLGCGRQANVVPETDSAVQVVCPTVGCNNHAVLKEA